MFLVAVVLPDTWAIGTLTAVDAKATAGLTLAKADDVLRWAMGWRCQNIVYMYMYIIYIYRYMCNNGISVVNICQIKCHLCQIECQIKCQNARNTAQDRMQENICYTYNVRIYVNTHFR